MQKLTRNSLGSQENTSASNFFRKETLAQVFSCKFCENFKNTFFTENLRVTTSAS